MNRLRNLFVIITLTITTAMNAQNIYICQGADVTTVSMQNAGDMTYTDNGATLSIAGTTYKTSEIDSITKAVPNPKFVGGDISLLTKYETNGAAYFDNSGKSITNVLSYLKQQGWNALRVRLFVNPANASTTDKGQGVCQDLDYVTALGKRIKAAGFRFMLDFHYSDSWADPSKQAKPSDWSSMTLADLESEMYTYTKSCLQTLVDAGATPDFIQTGNEISYGMLWETGRIQWKSTTNWNVFSALLANATKACREVCPKAKIIIHTERVPDNDYTQYYYNNLSTYGVDYDYIGLSYYPYYHGYLPQLNTVLTNLETNFPTKKIMIVETGYYHKWQPNSSDIKYDYSKTYPITEAGQKAFTDALISTLNGHKNVNGLFWWHAEANGYNVTSAVTTDWYNAGLFDNETGKAESALSELKLFK